MEVKDITDEWVKKNVDIEKERKTLEASDRIYNYNLEDLFANDKIEINEFTSKLNTIIEIEREKFNATFIGECSNLKVYISNDLVWNFEDHELETRIIYTYDVKETDKEVISRIKKSEKAKITKAK